jgi:RNA polymerase sigma-70 factor, ECF subfamily
LRAMEQTLALVPDTDLELVQSLASGRQQALADLMQRHGRWVRGLVFSVLGDRDDLDDVCQEVWLAVWRNIRTVQDLEKWRPWLYRLARNVALDAGRRKSHRRRLWQRVKGFFQPHRAVAPPADRLAAEREQHERVLRAIESMPEGYRQVFVMRHLDGLNYAEIASTLGLSAEGVETRLVRARRLLRGKLLGMSEHART